MNTGMVKSLPWPEQPNGIISLYKISPSVYDPHARKNGCQVFAENVRQKLKTGQRYVYPDIIYTCDPADLENDMAVWVDSPSLLIEVVSVSTHGKDLHDKRPHYTKIPSLLYYLLVSQTDYRVEVFERNVDFWKYQIIEGGDAIVNLPLLDMTLPLAEIYEGVVHTVE